MAISLDRILTLTNQYLINVNRKNKKKQLEKPIPKETIKLLDSESNKLFNKQIKYSQALSKSKRDEAQLYKTLKGNKYILQGVIIENRLNNKMTNHWVFLKNNLRWGRYQNENFENYISYPQVENNILGTNRKCSARCFIYVPKSDLVKRKNNMTIYNAKKHILNEMKKIICPSLLQAIKTKNQELKKQIQDYRSQRNQTSNIINGNGEGDGNLNNVMENYHNGSTHNNRKRHHTAFDYNSFFNEETTNQNRRLLFGDLMDKPRHHGQSGDQNQKANTTYQGFDYSALEIDWGKEKYEKNEESTKKLSQFKRLFETKYFNTLSQFQKMDLGGIFFTHSIIFKEDILKGVVLIETYNHLYQNNDILLLQKSLFVNQIKELFLARSMADLKTYNDYIYVTKMLLDAISNLKSNTIKALFLLYQTYTQSLIFKFDMKVIKHFMNFTIALIIKQISLQRVTNKPQIAQLLKNWSLIAIIANECYKPNSIEFNYFQTVWDSNFNMLQNLILKFKMSHLEIELTKLNDVVMGNFKEDVSSLDIKYTYVEKDVPNIFENYFAVMNDF